MRLGEPPGGWWRRLLLLALIVLPSVACDQFSKELARGHLAHGVPLRPFGSVVTLALAENPGSFLSLGSAWPSVLRVIAFQAVPLVVLLALAFHLVSGSSFNRFHLVAAALFLAGGLGNLLDRLFRSGVVTDFLYLELGPVHTGVFNLADVFVTAATALFLFGSWRDREVGAGLPH